MVPHVYDLGDGGDFVEVDGALQDAISSRAIVFYGGEDEGNDSLTYVNFADGGRGDDVLTASNVKSTFNSLDFARYRNPNNHNQWLDDRDNKGWLSEDNYNVLYGGMGFGDDRLEGNIHNDILIGGYGLDTINGGDGDDRIWGDGYLKLVWGAGTRVIR